MKTLAINPADNVAVALVDLAPGEAGAVEPIARGHKMALRPIAAGQPVIKYGCPIGVATADIPAGAWVHTHNVKTGLSEATALAYEPCSYPQPQVAPRTFQGFRRPDGRAAVRNEIWLLPLVGCVNSVAAELARRNQNLAAGSIEGLYAFGHPYGCSQLGDDLAATRRVLADLCRHPNAGAVLVVALGCENLTLDSFKQELGKYDERRVKFLVCQEEADELAAGTAMLKELARYAAQFRREPIPAGELVVGLKCGGSDGLSGLTANPTVGRFSDMLVALGGTTVLTETPEMFGAERLLFNRAASRQVFDEAVAMVEAFKAYFTAHGQTVYENPSPGNKAGGITTLEDKSCGCVQKGGTSPVAGVLKYGDVVKVKGLNLLAGPGNDLVSATALTAAGAHLILFTTGRGTPFGAPAPTVKIATNTALFERKPGWLDFNAGPVAEGEPLEAAGARLLDCVLEVAGGRPTSAEKRGARGLAIFKDGVTL